MTVTVIGLRGWTKLEKAKVVARRLRQPKGDRNFFPVAFSDARRLSKSCIMYASAFRDASGEKIVRSGPIPHGFRKDETIVFTDHQACMRFRRDARYLGHKMVSLRMIEGMLLDEGIREHLKNRSKIRSMEKIPIALLTEEDDVDDLTPKHLRWWVRAIHSHLEGRIQVLTEEERQALFDGTLTTEERLIRANTLP